MDLLKFKNLLTVFIFFGSQNLPIKLTRPIVLAKYLPLDITLVRISAVLYYYIYTFYWLHCSAAMFMCFPLDSLESSSFSRTLSSSFSSSMAISCVLLIASSIRTIPHLIYSI